MLGGLKETTDNALSAFDIDSTGSGVLTLDMPGSQAVGGAARDLTGGVRLGAIALRKDLAGIEPQKTALLQNANLSQFSAVPDSFVM